MALGISEAVVEEAALEWFGQLGYEIASGPSIAPGELGAQRASYDQVVLEGRLRDALRQINPGVEQGALDEAFRKLVGISSPQLVDANHALHYYLVNGVEVEYLRADGSVGYDAVQVLDFASPEANDWLVVSQFTVTEAGRNRRPDVVVFVNGLPLAVIELKNAADEKATVWGAFQQLQTYKSEISSLFVYNEILVASDGVMARVGTISSNRERFAPWREVGAKGRARKAELEIVIRDMFERRRLLDLVRYFIAFEADGDVVIKKMAGYHQVHAVERAIEATLAASGPGGDRRVGVVWHTQGSGKSLTMAFYAGRVVLHPAMRNPTVVVLTDRSDLDEQLFDTFARCHELLRQHPAKARDRDHLRALLRVASGGVVFTTVQKFLPDKKGDPFPLLSDRENIIVIADEAHRSQYDFIDGFARRLREALPKASFVGFTGTPVELSDKNTRAVFGDYLSVYDVQQAVDDGATVRIFYEGRFAQLALRDEERPRIDESFEEVTEGEEREGKERLKAKWSALEALVGTSARVRLVADDLVRHYETRLAAIEGKAMVVCMSRRICVELYKAIIALRPAWDSDDDAAGSLKIVMTGSASDPSEWQPHIRTKAKREALARRLKDPDDPLKMVIVRDMWLTGFDAPCLHTMYVDKPMQGHGLMQAIARVNRVFRDKPGGLVVDYLNLLPQLKQALLAYSQTSQGHGQEKPVHDQADAVAQLLEAYGACVALFQGFDRGRWHRGSPTERMNVLPEALEHVLAQPKGQARLSSLVGDLSRAFALAATHEEAIRIRDDVGFFQAVRVSMTKTTTSDREASGELDHAVRQLVSTAVASDQITDLFTAAGLETPDLSLLSDRFLAKVRAMPQRNLAVAMMRRSLDDEVRARSRQNFIEARSFAALLERAVQRYESRAIEAAELVDELVALAKAMREAERRGPRLGLGPDELAIYDALDVDAAVKALGEEAPKAMARELVGVLRHNVTLDWSVKESSRAKLRVAVKRVLRKHSYPPDKQEAATGMVLRQAEVLSEQWTSDPMAPRR